LSSVFGNLQAINNERPAIGRRRLMLRCFFPLTLSGPYFPFTFSLPETRKSSAILDRFCWASSWFPKRGGNESEIERSRLRIWLEENDAFVSADFPSKKFPAKPETEKIEVSSGKTKVWMPTATNLTPAKRRKRDKARTKPRFSFTEMSDPGGGSVRTDEPCSDGCPQPFFPWKFPSAAEDSRHYISNWPTTQIPAFLRSGYDVPSKPARLAAN
jgi:hypothetical protein